MSRKQNSNYKAAKTTTGRKKQQAAIRASYAKQGSKKIKSKSPPGRVINNGEYKPVHTVSEVFPHFRNYLKSGHPALIVAEHSSEEYRYRKVMHGEKDGDRNNEKVYPNPNPRDGNPMYIGKRVRHDKKKFFSKTVLPWKYPKKK